MTACQWYALCTREAAGTTPHPILGDVPICQRCADKHRLPVVADHAEDCPGCEGAGRVFLADPAGGGRFIVCSNPTSEEDNRS